MGKGKRRWGEVPANIHAAPSFRDTVTERITSARTTREKKLEAAQNIGKNKPKRKG